jgi:hypothetical protein
MSLTAKRYFARRPQNTGGHQFVKISFANEA